jgi:hypothetical protein
LKGKIQKLEFSQKSLSKILKTNNDSVKDLNFSHSKFMLNKGLRIKSYKKSKDIIGHLNGYGSDSYQNSRKPSLNIENESINQQRDQKILSLKTKIKQLKNKLSN